MRWQLGSRADMTAIRVSAQLQPQHADWPTMRRSWAEAEEIGADCLFNWETPWPLAKLIARCVATRTACTSRR